MGGLWGSRW